MGVIIIPVIAAILPVRYALACGIAAGMLSCLLNLGLATVFSFYAIAIITIPMVFGSFAWRHRLGPLVPILFLTCQGLFYLFYYLFEATPLWLTHYVTAIVFAGLYAITNYRGLKLPALVLSTTMCENAMMNIGSILILSLPADLWSIITPVSVLERAIATVGAMLIIWGIRHFASRYISI